MTKRIAMWSGPRNLSTAMMYAFGARPDCHVIDEPFYAAYLAKTGLDHPMRAEILASQPQDPSVVAKNLASGRAPIQYEKHMTHHMVDGFPLDWMADVTNVFLIRHPVRVIASYARKREKPTLQDIGFVQQLALFERCDNPIVIDATDIRTDPPGMLAKLCAALDIAWMDEMLQWPACGHPADGVWAVHWYGAVHRSTGFDGPEGPVPDIDQAFDEVLQQSLSVYEALQQHRL